MLALVYQHHGSVMGYACLCRRWSFRGCLRSGKNAPHFCGSRLEKPEEPGVTQKLLCEITRGQQKWLNRYPRCMGFKVKLGLMRDFHGGFYVGFLSQFSMAM